MNIIKQMRTRENKTVSEFAQELSVSKSYIEKLEINNKKPGREFLSKLKKRYPELDMNIFF